MHPNSGTDGNSLAGFRLHCPGVPNSVPGALNLEQTYHIVIEYTQSWLYVEIDGESVYDASHQTHTNYDEMVVYGSDPWYGAADVTVSNVIIWSGGTVSFLNGTFSPQLLLSLSPLPHGELQRKHHPRPNPRPHPLRIQRHRLLRRRRNQRLIPLGIAPCSTSTVQMHYFFSPSLWW